MHDWAVLSAIGAIAGLTALALWLGSADGALAGAVTALATLGGVKLALHRKDG